MRLIIMFAAFVLLSGCGAEPNKTGVQGVTPAEAEALNDAAAMLDQTEPPPRLIDDAGQDQAPPTPVK